MAQLGFRSINEMVGRVDYLDSRKAIAHWKAKGLDFSSILYKPEVPSHIKTYCSEPQDHGIDDSLDVKQLLRFVQAGARASNSGDARSADSQHQPHGRHDFVQRSHAALRRHGFEHEDTIQLNFKGSAGQSLLAFGVHGVTVRVEGDVNDYCGKGLSGGKIIVYPPREAVVCPRKTSLPATSVYTAPPAASCFCAALPASGSAFATAARMPSWKASAIMVANT